MPVLYAKKKPWEYGIFFAKIMEKIKKNYNLKIISLVLTVIFSISPSAYGISLSNNRSYLRIPLATDSEKDKQRLAEVLTVFSFLKPRVIVKTYPGALTTRSKATAIRVFAVLNAIPEINRDEIEARIKRAHAEDTEANITIKDKSGIGKVTLANIGARVAQDGKGIADRNILDISESTSPENVEVECKQALEGALKSTDGPIIYISIACLVNYEIDGKKVLSYKSTNPDYKPLGGALKSTVLAKLIKEEAQRLGFKLMPVNEREIGDLRLEIAGFKKGDLNKLITFMKYIQIQMQDNMEVSIDIIKSIDRELLEELGHKELGDIIPENLLLRRSSI